MIPIEGVDYSYDPPAPGELAAAGKRFAVRYGAVGKPAKHLTAAELTGLRTAGLNVVANVEETARAYTGAAAGERHALAGDGFFRRLGMPGDRPIYFSVDWDAQPADWPGIDEALRASATVLGANRVGVYGSYDTIAHCAQGGTAAWFWQTYAWSGGRWHPACHLQQYKNNISLGGGTVDLTRAVALDYGQWGGAPLMAMDPITHPRGTAPNFSMAGLPPNPNPRRVTDALWWLVQMRLRLEPRSQNGGILAFKPGYHSYGSRLPDTDHSVRRAPDREGPWWHDFSAAHDWTFDGAHTGDYTQIKKYSNRLRNAMRDPNDPRPDDVYAYFIGQIDDDRVVEGYNEYRDEEETGDSSHLWHTHYSFRRNIVGDYWAMWKALTIDMGWSVAEWQRSVTKEDDDMNAAEMTAWAQSREGRNAIAVAVLGHDPGVDADGKVRPGGIANPDPEGAKTNPTVAPTWPLNRSIVAAALGYEIRGKIDALSKEVGATRTALLSALAALTAKDQVDEAALAAQLAPALAAAVRAELGDGVDPVTTGEVEAAFERVMRRAFTASPTA